MIIATTIFTTVANSSDFYYEGVSTYRWCWLIGHDKVKDTVIVTEHKVEEKHPRCIKRIYDIETCTACDYIKETLTSETYIVCCPED